MTDFHQNSSEKNDGKLLIVAATKQELSGFFSHYQLTGDRFIQHRNFDVLITGVGMTATAFALGRYLTKDYYRVLNVGIAGSFDKSIPLGNLVAVKSDVFAELGAEDNEKFLTIDELGFGKAKFEAGYLIEDLDLVQAITVNKVHGNAESITKVLARFEDVQIESMEGAAVFYCCNALNINCAQVRSISNYVEPRSKENWQIGLAVKNLNDWLIGLHLAG